MPEKKRKLIPIVGSTGLINGDDGKEVFVVVTEKTTSGNALMKTEDGVIFEAKLDDLKLAWKRWRGSS